MRAKSINKALFKVSDCQNATNMWFFIEDLRKKCHWFYKISPHCIRRGQKSIFTIKHWFYGKNSFFGPSWCKEGKFYKKNGIFLLKSSMENHISVAFWQWVALKGALFSDFAPKSDLALLSRKLQIAFFQKRLERFFLNFGFKLST